MTRSLSVPLEDFFSVYGPGLRWLGYGGGGGISKTKTTGSTHLGSVEKKRKIVSKGVLRLL